MLLYPADWTQWSVALFIALWAHSLYGKGMLLWIQTQFFELVSAMGLLAIVGALFSILAFREAKKAKTAAGQAGTTVKIQTITIELTEVMQKLDRLDIEIQFSVARDLLNEVSRRLRRLIAPFKHLSDLEAVYAELIVALDEAKLALDNVRPDDAQTEDAVKNAVYYAIQGHFATVSDKIAEVMGLLEKRTIEVEA